MKFLVLGFVVIVGLIFLLGAWIIKKYNKRAWQEVPDKTRPLRNGDRSWVNISVLVGVLIDRLHCKRVRSVHNVFLFIGCALLSISFVILIVNI